MKFFSFFGLSMLVVFFLHNFLPDGEKFQLSGDMPVEEVLVKLGNPPTPHQPQTIPGASAIAGEELVKYGITLNAEGNKIKKQSKHFVCTSCHNLQREDPDLSVSDPQARLQFAEENNLPFLQGTTLYGAVNRSTFYNGDYDKKYGALTAKARNNFREAIQLCAVECSQGRMLQPWEMESILGYLWTLELKIEDLNLSETEQNSILNAVNNNESKDESIKLIQSKFLSGSPATFIPPPDDRHKGYGLKGDPENGRRIYKRSCLHCHEGQRYSFFELEKNKNSKAFLSKHFPEYSRYSVYQVGRYGTPPLAGKRSYMPQYTAEKMSEQQMEDLRAYLEE